MFRFWILDFGFWIGRTRLLTQTVLATAFGSLFASFAPLREPSSLIQNPKPKIQKWAILFILPILL